MNDPYIPCNPFRAVGADGRGKKPLRDTRDFVLPRAACKWPVSSVIIKFMI
jgi:hypothetical protein